jgi:hypothetical protein
MTRRIVCLATLLSCAVGFDAWGASPPSKKERAAQFVREALHHESLGLNRERNELLDAARATDPDQAQANWADGKVRYQKDWVAADKVPELVQANRVFARYVAKRAEFGDSIEGHLEVANWCQKNGLREQERAHLFRVLDLNPEHAPARQRLGFVRAGNQWVSLEEMQAQQRSAAVQLEEFRRWQPKIVDLQKDLLAKASGRRRAAEERLAKINDASAITAIEAILCPTSPEVALQAVPAMAGIGDEQATLALARQSIYSVWPEVREACAKALVKRPFEQFVPLLLSSLYTPTEARVNIFRGPGNRLMLEHTLAREGQAQREVAVLGTAYQRQALVGGDANETTQRAKLNMFEQTVALQQQVALQNLTTATLNKRLTDTLTLATGEKCGEKPEAWWQWWNDYNEVFMEGPKAVAVNVIIQEVQIADRPPPPPLSVEEKTGSGRPLVRTGGGSSSPVDHTAERARPANLSSAASQSWTLGRLNTGCDCLAAGTPVQTAQGMTAIEEIKVGDLVLSQDPQSGELTYKPVLKTTIRPAGKLVKVEVGADQRFEASGGHLFWVAGDGWVKARELKSGMLLHTPTGAAHVSAVEPGSNAKTYNLIVADYHTYFAGNLKVLSHDNTVRRSSQSAVPGLRLE